MNTTQSSYRNPWFTPSGIAPQVYTTTAKAIEYRGYVIYERIKGCVWDVVRDGVCRTQRAGLSGAKGYVDAMLDHDDSCECHYCVISRVHTAEQVAA